MAEIGAFGFVPFGGESLIQEFSNFFYGGTQTLNLNALNSCACYRYTATTTKDVKSVKMSWTSVVGGPPTIEMRIETIDTSTGKPTGTLYDSGSGGYATKSFNPSSATTWRTVTFDTLPTAGMTVGTEYGIVFINTANNGATTTQLRYYTRAAYPIQVFYATDGTTRSNLTEISNGAQPICTLVFEDDTEESVGMCPYTGTSSNFLIYGTDRWAGALFTIPTGIQIKVRGMAMGYFAGTGTLASRGNLRIRILDSVNAEEYSRTIDMDSLTVASSTVRRMEIAFDPVTLAAGSHRIVFDSSGGDASNCWVWKGAQASSAKFVPSSWIYTSCTDASTGPTWSNDNTIFPPVSLLLDDITSTGGTTESFTGTLINRGIQ